MRQVREIIRLVSAHVPTREIARRLRIAASTVRETTFRKRRPRLAPAGYMTDGKLETALYTAPNPIGRRFIGS